MLFKRILDFKKIRIADLKSPEERMFAVLDWYLTSFHQINKVGFKMLQLPVVVLIEQF